MAAQDVATDVVLQQISARQLQGQVGSMQHTIAAAYAEARGNRRAVRGLARAFDKLCKGLMGLEHAAPPSPLAKAVRSVLVHELGREPTPAEARHVAPALVAALGDQGGQAYPWSRERESRLRLCEALTKSQCEVWRRVGRVPDTVDLAHPGPSAAVEQERAAAFNAAMALSQLSPLYLAHVLHQAGGR